MSEFELIGERSEPPSDKLDDEIFISSSASHWIYGVIRPDNQYHAHSHCVRTLTFKGWFFRISSRSEIIIFPSRRVDRIESSSMKCLTLKFSLYQHQYCTYTLLNFFIPQYTPKKLTAQKKIIKLETVKCSSSPLPCVWCIIMKNIA